MINNKLIRVVTCVGKTGSEGGSVLLLLEGLWPRLLMRGRICQSFYCICNTLLHKLVGSWGCITFFPILFVHLKYFIIIQKSSLSLDIYIGYQPPVTDHLTQ